jgi:hypothetical protein
MADNRYNAGGGRARIDSYAAKNYLDENVDGETVSDALLNTGYQEYGDKFNHAFWINDLYFEVPPERISSQEENSYAEFQSLRSNSASKIPVGIASEIFTINLNIVSKNSIVNIDDRTSEVGPAKYTNDYENNNTQKRGGILDLIIQFKHIPFSVVENAYLRAKLKIPLTHNMVFCMHNLAMSTSPGEPGTLVASLTMSPLGYTPYSDKWLFKKNWDAKNGSSFFDVNMNYEGILRKLPDWHKYPTRLDESEDTPESRTYYFGSKSWYVNPKLRDRATATTTESDCSVVNPAYQTVDSINSLDRDFMVTSDITQFPYESTLYKQYIDWLHARWAQKIVNNEQDVTLNRYDFTKISPYNSQNHDLGDAIVLKWKEFKSIQIDPVVADTIRTYYKRKLALDRARLFKIRMQGDMQLIKEGYTEEEIAAFAELETTMAASMTASGAAGIGP